MRKQSSNTVFNTLTFLVVGALLSGVGWLIVKMFDLSSTLSATNSTVNVTAQRVDRIVGALPELKLKIATEELKKEIGVAVITRPPIELSNSVWARSVIFLDYNRGKLQEFRLPARDAGDISSVYTVVGLTNGISIEKATFEEMTAASVEIGEPKPCPTWIDPQGSSTLLRLRLDYARQIERQFGKPFRELPIGKKRLNWPQLVDELRELENRLNAEETPRS